MIYCVFDNGTLMSFREYAGGKAVDVTGFGSWDDAQTYLRASGYDASAYEIREVKV